MEIKNYGFKKPTIESDHYVLGASATPQIVLRPDGQWDTPEFEEQRRNGIETYNCTGFGTCSCLEIVMKVCFSVLINFSDRALGIMAGTKDGGNDPHTVIEAARCQGLLKEWLLPFTDLLTTIEEYYSPNPLPDDLKATALNFLKDYRIWHEWVFNRELGKGDEIARMKQALQYSPLGVSVYAWKQGQDGLYFKEDEQDNHWTVCYGYEEGTYWKIFDTYDGGFKKLRWDYNFGFVKRYAITKLEEKKTQKMTIVSAVIWLFSLIRGIIRV